MRFIHITGILFWTVSATTLAAPPAIVTQGKGAAIACASCHGMEGAGNSAGGYPALAQMPQAYFTKQIADFKSGTRTNAIMTPIAKALTPEDAEAAASFYAGLPRPQSPSAPADAGLVARGENLAINGAWDRGLPACFKCHAPGGTGVAPSFPPIAGQHVGDTVRSQANDHDPDCVVVGIVHVSGAARVNPDDDAHHVRQFAIHDPPLLD